MDRIEQTVRRKDEQQYTKDKFKYHCLYALAALFSLSVIGSLVTLFAAFANPYISVSMLDLISLLLSVALALAFFFLKDEMLIEYDYMIEDDNFIVAKIKNLKARKEVVNVPISALKRITPYNAENYKSLDIKKLNCALNSDEEKYVLFYERGESCAVVFEPNEALLKMITKELNK